MKISNTEVYGLKESVKKSGYPKVSDMGEMKPYVHSKDFDRAEKLSNCKLGTGHDNFLNGIIVHFDIRGSQYFWMQWGRYNHIHEGGTDSLTDIVSSQSKMHCITGMDIKKQCNKYVFDSQIEFAENLVKKYKNGQIILDELIANLPTGLTLTAGIVTNYRQLKTIYHQRRNHDLQCWQVFCDWIESLPYSRLITDGS